MRVFVLGAGRMGSAVVQDLIRTRKDIEFGIGDMLLDRVRSWSRKRGKHSK